MPSLTDQITNALNAQDVVLSTALANLKDNSTDLSNFINARKTEIYDSVAQEHSDAFAKVHHDLINSGESLKNIAFYHARNDDLNATQRELYDKSQMSMDGIQRNRQSAKRQFEINEWTVGNKMDTLFVFQLLFLALCLMVPLVYLNRLGLMPTNTLSIITFILATVIALTFAVRYQYTSLTRDLRFWNRRRFPKEAAPPVPPICSQNQSESFIDTAAPYS